MTKEKAIEEEMTIAGLCGQITANLNVSIKQQKSKVKGPLKNSVRANRIETTRPELLFTVKVTGSALGMNFVRKYENLEARYINNIIDDVKIQFMNAVRNHYYGLKLVATLPKTTSTPVTIDLTDQSANNVQPMVGLSAGAIFGL